VPFRPLLREHFVSFWLPNNIKLSAASQPHPTVKYHCLVICQAYYCSYNQDHGGFFLACFEDPFKAMGSKVNYLCIESLNAASGVFNIFLVRNSLLNTECTWIIPPFRINRFKDNEAK